MTSPLVPWHRDGASEDRADYLIYEDDPRAEMEEERAWFRTLPGITADEADAINAEQVATWRRKIGLVS